MKCNNCRKEYPREADYCPHCGVAGVKPITIKQRLASANRLFAEGDIRGGIAILFSVGCLLIALICVWKWTNKLEAFTTVMAVLGPLLAVIIKDYFQSESERQSKEEGGEVT